MDPRATLALINDSGLSLEERIEAVHNLCGWLVRGGYFPCGEAGDAMHPGLTAEAMDTLHMGDGIAASLNCALVNADLSGLAYLVGEM